MVPTRLRLRNFLSYAAEELSLDGIQVACLCGPNGHGKTALLDAMTWALWEKARAATDALIRAGQTEMLVELDFRLDDRLYRVTRRRVGGRRAQSDLQLQVLQADGSWRTQSAEKIRATEQVIQSLLRLDYDTFVNSAFILQGRADELSRRGPAERKKILSEVLGLGRYEELCASARERRAQAQARAASLEAEVARLGEEFARLGEHETRASELRLRSAEATARLEAARRTLQATLAERARLEERARQGEDLAARTHAGRERLASDELRLKACEESIRKAREIFDQAETLRALAQEQSSLLQEKESLSVALLRLRELERRREAVRGRIAEAESALLRRIDLARLECGHLRQSVERLNGVRRDLVRLQADLDGFSGVEEAIRETTEVRSARVAERAVLTEARPKLAEAMEQASERFEALKKARAICPVCEGELSDERRRELGLQTREVKRELEKGIASTEERLGQIGREVAELDRRLAQLEKRRRDGQILREKLASARHQEQELAPAEAGLPEKEASVAALEQQLAAASFAAEARAELGQVEAEIRGVPYDGARSARIESRLQQLAGADRRLEGLQRAEAEAPVLEAQAAEIRSQIEAQRKQLAGDLAALDLLERDLAALPAIRDREAGQADQVQEQESLAAGLLRELAAAESAVDRCREAGEALQIRRKEREASAEDALLYGELVRAFGKDGIPALIIENAVPELQRDANEILTRLTGGQMQVRIQTQRQLRSGGMSETLEIEIGDGLGFRAYELFSGGEAFRVNFAIRIALSRLLAHRAGARLETLIIDEGFGSQDEEGRLRLVDAIQSVQPDFGLILVITHLDEMKEQFPVRIEVSKGPDGSRASIL